MTKKLYDEIPYETEFTAVVVKCEANNCSSFAVILDQTLFFPEEGGQTPDLGYIFCENQENKKIEVLDVQIDKMGTIRHTISEAIEEGTKIQGKVDWKRRFYNMQQHTGEHIFSGLVHSRFGYNNVGFHLSDNDVTMDYDGVLTEDDILSLEYTANEVIAKNVPVKCYYPNEKELSSLDYRSKKELDGPIRIVEVEGCDICACCAPHVKSSAEVGLFKVISFQSWKGGTRVYALCGFRALNEFNNIQKAALEVSHEFSVPVSKEDFSSAFEKQKNNIAGLKIRVADLESQLMDYLVKESKTDSPNILVFTNGFSDILRRNKLSELSKMFSGYCCIFDGDDIKGYSFIIASSSLDCNGIVKLMKENFETRGGGRPVMVQGHVNATRLQLESLLK